LAPIEEPSTFSIDLAEFASRYGGTSPSFIRWRAAVDARVSAMTGLSLDDLSDCCYRDWYEQGMKPARAARRAIREAGGAAFGF